MSVRAVFYAAAGDTTNAERNIQITLKGEARATHFHHAWYQMGQACALMKQNERAIQYLRNAATDGFLCYPYFENDPLLKNLRGTAEFGSFLKEQKAEWERLRKNLVE